jgi:integrase/recombinase XerD
MISQSLNLNTMQSRNTFSILFYLRRARIVNGRSPIFARITVNKQRVEISTKRNVEVSSLNSDRGRVRGTRDEIKELNTFLD